MLARAIPAAIDNGDTELAHANLRRAASSCLSAAMAYARYDADFISARRHFSQGADYADTLCAMAGKGLPGTPWSGFFVLYCALISGRFDKALKVANWIMTCPPVAEDSADQHDPLAKLSGLAVLDEREKFELYRSERYTNSWHSKHPFFGPLSVYLDLWQAVLDRDQKSFDSAMVLREEHCIRLSNQKEEGRLEFGGGVESKYVVDFMGLGCAISARRLGMKCDVDTVYLPRALADLAVA